MKKENRTAKKTVGVEGKCKVLVLNQIPHHKDVSNA
jgi:hypothetical protein